MARLPSEEYGLALAAYVGRATGAPPRGVQAVEAAGRGAARPREAPDRVERATQSSRSRSRSPAVLLAEAPGESKARALTGDDTSMNTYTTDVISPSAVVAPIETPPFVRNKLPAFGVNYGNRFVPEHWMSEGTGEEKILWQDVAPQGCEPDSQTPKLSLPDLGKTRFERRMLEWLDKTVQEDDFKKMREQGVEVVRVPTGYWNWITCAGDQGPDAPPEQAARMRVLTTLAPGAYKPYLQKIFEWAKNSGLKIWLDLHAVPGSANGQDHGGICTAKPYWGSEWSIRKSIEAVGAMAEYAAKWGDVLFGLQVINEPNKYNDDIHDTLRRYYSEAILEARKYLPMSVPVIIFDWTYNFHKWPSDCYGEHDRYGTVYWDTHIYTVGQPTTKTSGTMDVYWQDMMRLEEFNKRQRGGVIVGEWSLAGTEYRHSYPSDDFKKAYQKLSSWVVWCFMERCSGCIFWNWDARIAQWSYQKSGSQLGVDWVGIKRPPAREQ